MSNDVAQAIDRLTRAVESGVAKLDDIRIALNVVETTLDPEDAKIFAGIASALAEISQKMPDASEQSKED